MRSTQDPYSYDDYERAGVLTDTMRPIVPERTGREPELATKRVVLHIVLFLLTCVTTTITGILLSEPGQGIPLVNGLIFGGTLLLILGSHEFGHYFACRYYGIRATLPFFIPGPPLITPLGTFGAVIKIKEPITSRKALFDIGIAGPLAGFAVAVPAAFIGLLMSKAAPDSVPPPGTLLFQDPVLFKIIINAFHLPPMILWNPVYWAAWGALLVTALNLFPVGQLDGGHVLYAVVGRRLHRIVSLVVCLAVGSLAVASFFSHRPPFWVLWTLVLGFMFWSGHPPVIQHEPLGKGRIALALLAVVVFILCFMPFPAIIT